MKELVFSFLSKAYRGLSRRPNLLSVATFHRVGGTSSIDRDTVRRHMKFIKENYQVILPSELSAKISFTPPLAMITIDDGHRDVYDSIYPVAKEFDIPIVVCLSTDFFFRNEWLWFDQLYWILSHASEGDALSFDCGNLIVGDEEALSAFKRYMKTRMPLERDRILAGFAMQAGCCVQSAPIEEDRAVELEQMKEMLSSGLVEICAHTVTHTIATRLPDNEFRRELEASKKELEEWASTKIISFCYPNGLEGDFDERTAKALRDTGYEMAFTSIEGVNNSRNLDLYKIKRVHAHQEQGVFERNMLGFRFF